MTFKLKQIYMPYAAMVVLAAAALILARGALGAHHSEATVNSEEKIEAGTAINSEDPKVTINGQEVDPGADGAGTFHSKGATVNISGNSATVTSHGGSTTVTRDDGGIDVTVESNSTSGFNQSTVQVGGVSQTFHHENSGFSVFQSGEGNITVTDN